MMAYYVRRSSKKNAAGFAYVGPIRSLSQAERELAAWESAGETAELLGVTTATRAAVARWQKVTHADDAHDLVWFHGEQMTMAQYRLFHEVAA